MSEAERYNLKLQILGLVLEAAELHGGYITTDSLRRIIAQVQQAAERSLTMDELRHIFSTE